VLPTSGHVNLAVFNADGKLIRTIVDAPLGTGPKSYTWDGRDDHNNPVSSGVYFCRLEAGNQVMTQKMTFIK
jgi:flagellar hook assembly protein FlgD